MGIISKFKQYRNREKRSSKKKEKKQTTPEEEMSFLEHVEELRWHLVRSLAAIASVGILIFIYRQWFMDEIILAPFSPDFPVNTILCRINDALCDPVQVNYIAYGPFEQFLTAIKLGFVGGFIVSFPYVLFEVWRFIKPGLHSHEKNRFRGGVFILSMLFFMGVAFAYYIITPFSVQFLANFALSEQVSNEWRIGQVIAVMTQIPLAGGIMFELPVFVYVFSKMGLLTPEIMKTYRKHAIVVLLVLSAILTPPDVTSQVLIFIPLFILYQISILISHRVNVQREKELMGDDADNNPPPPPAGGNDPAPAPPTPPNEPAGTSEVPASEKESKSEPDSKPEKNTEKSSFGPEDPFWQPNLSHHDDPKPDKETDPSSDESTEDTSKS